MTKIGVTESGKMGGALTHRRTSIVRCTHLIAISLLAWMAWMPARAADIPLPSPGASDRIDTIRQRGVLRVAVLAEAPWLVRSNGGSAPFEGPAWKLATEYASRLGVRLATTPVDYGNKVSVVNGDSVDLSIAPAERTPERDRIADFVTYSSYNGRPIVMAVAKNQPVLLRWLQDVAAALKPELDAEEARVSR